MKLTRRALAVWLVSSAAVIGVTMAAKNDGPKKNLFGRPNLEKPKDELESSSSSLPSKSSSWPWVEPGGAAEPLVLSLDEELESLEVSIPLSQSTLFQKQGRDSPLFRDIEMLTEILLETVKDEDETIYNLYFEFLKYGQER